MRTSILHLFLPCILSVALTSCYQQLSLEGFDKELWEQDKSQCNDYRLRTVDHILENESVLLEKTQNEVESLLGQADEHELYERNQKFFHYRLTPPDSCGTYQVKAYLSVRFNAIGRANLVQKMLRD